MHWPNGHLSKDREILNLAVNEQRGIVTKDHDFLDNFLLHGIPPLVLLLEYGNISNRDLLQLVASQWSKTESTFENGANFVKASRASLTVWS